MADWFSFAMLFRAFRNTVAVAFMLGMLLAPRPTTAIFTGYAMHEIQRKADWFDQTVTPAIMQTINDGLGAAAKPPPARKTR